MNSKKKKKKRKRKKADIESDTESQEAVEPSNLGKKNGNLGTPPAKKLKMSPSKVTAEDSLHLKSSGKKNKKSLSVEKGNKIPHGALKAKEKSEHTQERGLSSNEAKNCKKKHNKIGQEKKLTSLDQEAKSEESFNTQNIEEKQESNNSIMKKGNKKQEVSETTLKKVKKKRDTVEQRRKKRKLSINMSKTLRGDESEVGTDSKTLKRQLSKIMSASRLSKYGLGPNASKDVKRKKKKKN